MVYGGQFLCHRIAKTAHIISLRYTNVVQISTRKSHGVWATHLTMTYASLSAFPLSNQMQWKIEKQYRELALLSQHQTGRWPFLTKNCWNDAFRYPQRRCLQVTSRQHRCLMMKKYKHAQTYMISPLRVSNEVFGVLKVLWWKLILVLGNSCIVCAVRSANRCLWSRSSLSNIPLGNGTPWHQWVHDVRLVVPTVRRIFRRYA